MMSLLALKRNAKPYVWLIAGMLAFFPLGQHAVGLVLCIETDGHMSIEDAVGLLCGPDASPHEHQANEAESSSHCGTCIDIPLYVAGDTDCGSFLVSTSPEAQVELPVVALIPASALLRHHANIQSRTQASMGAIFSPLADLSSIVLLI